MASAEDQAAAAALLGGDPAAFDALLSTLMSASNADRAQAEAAFHRLRASHPEPLALRLASSLAAPATPAELRAMAAVLLRKLLSPTPSSSDSSSSPTASAPLPLWPLLSPAGQNALKAHLLNALQSDPPKPIAKKVCDAISELATLLLPENTWAELLPFLFRAASTPEAPNLQESALLIFARLADYIAESLLDHLMTIHNLLASALAHPTSPDVRIAALSAAVNLVQCLPTNADRDKMQDLLPAMMRALTDCLNSAQEASAQEALELLVELAGAEPRFLRRQIADVPGAAAPLLAPGRAHSLLAPPVRDDHAPLAAPLDAPVGDKEVPLAAHLAGADLDAHGDLIGADAPQTPEVAPSTTACAGAGVSTAAFTSGREHGLRRCRAARAGHDLAGSVPARALYMAALEATKSSVGSAAVRFGISEPAASAVASAAGGVSAAVAAQVVWTPVDVISQRLMVQTSASCRYAGGADAFRKILAADGVRGLYRGFGLSIITYAPSNAVWWASYAMAQRFAWRVVGADRSESYPALMAVQASSAAVAGGAAALVTMPLDTVKTRLQVMETDGVAARPTLGSTMRGLLKEGGWAACYRGLGPRWGSMSLSAATMVTTYEVLKRLSAKEGSLR